MLGQKPRDMSSADPCGYECLLVDEDCLSGEDRRQAIVEAVDHPRDGTEFLTKNERAAMSQELVGIQSSISPYEYYQGEHSALSFKRAEYARLGSFRSCARDRYADGHSIWYGDSPPWLFHSGAAKPSLLEGPATGRNESTS